MAWQRPPKDAGRLRTARLLTALYATATIVAIVLTLFGRRGAATWLWREGFGLLNVPVNASFLSIVVLFLLTRALIGRKRIALWLVGFFQLAGIYIGLTAVLPMQSWHWVTLWRPHGTLGRTFDVIGLVAALAMLILLWRLRPIFTGRLLPGSWWLAVTAAAVGTVITVGVTWLLLGRHRSTHGQLDGMVDTVTAVLGGGVRHHVFGINPRLVDLTAFLAGLTLLVATWLFLMSARPQNRWSAEREIAIRQLLATNGVEDSLGYFATRRDRSAVFTADGRAAVTYRVIAGVCLAAADPIGDRASWPAAIRGWLAEARQYGWQPAVMAASENGARAYAAAGLRVLLMGDEAILQTGPTGPRRPQPGVRRAATGARRAGVTVRIRRQQDFGNAELAELTHASREWLQGAEERGFSMALNRDQDPTDGRSLVVTAHVNGQPVAMLRFVPWGLRGLSLDLMRRSPHAPHGVNELMVSELITHAERFGLAQVSLNFCMFRGVYAEAERIGGRALTRLNAGLLGIFDRFWQLERLYRANEKYQPDWQPRFLCYADALVLPRITLACAAAEGFVPWPRLRERHLHQFPVDRLPELAAITAQPRLGLDAPRGDDQTAGRMTRLARLRSVGVDPYPAAEPIHSEQPGMLVLTGRLRAIRDHGGVVFADLQALESKGSDPGLPSRLQLLLDADHTERFDLFTDQIQSGDLVLVTGVIVDSRTGTSSLQVSSWALQAKALHPIDWSASDDPLRRSADRSADLILHPDEMTVIKQRSVAVNAIRSALIRRRFTEVETPILQTIHGGAQARPFRTHLNSYNLSLSLRIAPELYLKRLLVAGSGPVFEIGRNFRNEGIDASHHPEFTALEAYEPGGDYRTMLELARELIISAATAVYGQPVISLPTTESPDDDEHHDHEHHDHEHQVMPGTMTDIGGPWPIVPMMEAVSEAVQLRVDLNTGLRTLRALAQQHGVTEADPNTGAGGLLEALYSKLVEPRTMSPTFYIDFPQETSPLTRPHRQVPGLVERWDLVAAGMEIGTAYTELTDPVDQRRRLTEQSLQAAAGDPEAMEIDEDFLSALELGMPPTGGLGLGIDRVIMLLTQRPIRSVLTFPFTRFTRSAPRSRTSRSRL